jgi:predicted N-acetyltransferase YhbS
MKVKRTWEAGWYEEQDKPGILAINQIQYGDVALSHEAYFDWLQTQNPMGSPILPRAREKETGKVVGFSMFIPMRVSWSGEERPALIGFNLVVALAYRRQGIHEMMAAAGTEEGKKRGYHDRFWEQVKTKYDLMLVRDRTFLQWRFHEIPCRSYQVLSARQGTEIVGYIVLRQTDVRGTKTGLIADFLVLPGEHGNQAGLRLLYEALQCFRQARLPLTGALMLPHTQEYAVMRQAGYLRAAAVCAAAVSPGPQGLVPRDTPQRADRA